MPNDMVRLFLLIFIVVFVLKKSDRKIVDIKKMTYKGILHKVTRL